MAKSPKEQVKLNAGIESANPAVTPKATKPKAKNLDPLHGAYSKCIDVAIQAGKISKSMGQEILKADISKESKIKILRAYKKYEWVNDDFRFIDKEIKTLQE